jgi:hypothetical protein
VFFLAKIFTWYTGYMKKTLLIGGLLIVIAIVVVAVVLGKKEDPVVVIPEPTPTQPIVMCYHYEQKQPSGFSDRAILKMNITGTGGTQVTGEYKNLPAEKDSKVGTFTGTVGPMDPAISARTADVWWNSMAEGMTVTEQLKIVFGEGSATAQFGEMVDRGDGTYIYKDVTKLTNGFQMSQVDCEILDERLAVDEYIRKNIKIIAPKKAVLGGTWYVTSVDSNTTAKTGTAAYEDGHVQETSTFSYTRTGDDVVIVWK